MPNVEGLVAELRVLVPTFVQKFEAVHGYPPGDHVVGGRADTGADDSTCPALAQLPDACRELLAACRELALPDLWNGVFVGPARWICSMAGELDALEIDAGPVPVIAVGSDGGGGHFLVRPLRASPVLHVAAGALHDGLLTPSAVAPTSLDQLTIAGSFVEFIERIATAVRRATTGVDVDPFADA